MSATGPMDQSKVERRLLIVAEMLDQAVAAVNLVMAEIRGEAPPGGERPCQQEPEPTDVRGDESPAIDRQEHREPENDHE